MIEKFCASTTGSNVAGGEAETVGAAVSAALAETIATNAHVLLLLPPPLRTGCFYPSGVFSNRRPAPPLCQRAE